MDLKISVRLINHACVLLEAGPVKLLCDPWLTGSCFNDGWDLIVDSQVGINDLEFTHIWISHEHPDHFSPTDIKNIDVAKRAKIPILYQETKDKKVKQFCESLGFEVIELPDYQKLQIADNVFVTCAKNRGSDSWLLFQAGEQKLLNLNDCFFNNESALLKIKSFVGKLDLLMSQYSFANWIGNEEDITSQRNVARMILELFAKQVAVLEPRFVMPFANFTWFSNEENAYMNRFASKVSDAVGALSALACHPIVLAPMEQYTIGQAHNNDHALAFWKDAYLALETKPKRVAKKVSLEQLQSAFLDYKERLFMKNSWWSILLTKYLGLLPTSYVYITDLACVLKFDITDELKIAPVLREKCSVEMSSGSLWFLLKNEWGRGTLQINGRFRANYKQFSKFIRQSQIAFANNIGLSYPATLTPLALMKPRTFVLRVAEGNAHLHL